MKMEDLKNDLKKIYNFKFKNSGVVIHDYSNFWGNNKECFVIKLYLSENEKECANNIIENDMFNISFEVEKVGENEYILKAFDTSYVIIPSIEYMYYGRKKVAFRKTKGDYYKILKAFTKFCGDLKESVIADIKGEKIHDNFKEIVKQKIDF